MRTEKEIIKKIQDSSDISDLSDEELIEQRGFVKALEWVAFTPPKIVITNLGGDRYAVSYEDEHGTVNCPVLGKFEALREAAALLNDKCTEEKPEKPTPPSD